MKKIYTLLLALMANVCFVQAAIETGSCGNNLTWTLDTKDSTLTVEGYGPMSSNGSPAWAWSYYKSYIKYVYLPEGLTNIASEAFKGCSNLVRINIPKSLTGSGSGAFKDCNNLDSVFISDIAAWCNISFYYDKYYNGTTSNPLVMAKHLYLNGAKLTNLVIPDSVKSINSYVFCNAVDIKSLTIQEGDTIIGISAFSGCSSLNSITLPSSLKEVQYGAFNGCANAKGVYISDIAAWCRTHFGFYKYTGDSISNPLYYAHHLYLNGEKVTDLVIPEGEQYIGQYALDGCSDLTSVVIPSSMLNINNNAFRKCTNISRFIVYATTPPNNARYSGLKNSSCKLYVPAESVDTYTSTVWWEDFMSIRAIGSMLQVKFIDWDGTILSTTEVEEGEAAVPPTNPKREGYTFIGWDKDFSNVTEDMVVTALYKINRYEVNFVDWDNTVLKSDSVDWNTAAIAPTNPYRKGYTFIGWNKNFEHITSDETIIAQYEMGEEKDVTILYTNGNDGGTILSHSVVLKMPEAPEIEGFTFLGWQPKAEFIDEIIEIQAIYKSDSEAAPQVVANPSNPSQKLIRNGNVYILQCDKTYTITGAEVK